MFIGFKYIKANLIEFWKYSYNFVIELLKKMENLLKFITEHADSDVSRLILDKGKYPDVDMSLAVNCIESRRKLKGKVQEWYENPSLIFPFKLSAEQCSSSATGRYKAEVAERIALEIVDRVDASNWSLADLTGGLGVDSWFFSQRAGKVIYNEMQTPLCDAAKHNFKSLGADNITVVNSTITPGNCLDAILIALRGDSMTGASEPKLEIVFIDPARRGEGGKKVFLIEECTPDVLTIKEEIFEHCRNLLIKLSPMADISMVCDRLGRHCREVHVVATAGECKELLIWMDREWDGDYKVIAVELHNDGTRSTLEFYPEDEGNTGRQMAPAYCLPATYIFEPGKSLMKAGCFNLIATRFGLSKLGKSTHYYITDSAEQAETLKQYGKVFHILECQPLDKRSIKDMGKKYPKAEVTARNIPIDTDNLRKKMGITSGDDAHIFGLKSDADGNLLIAAKRI